MIPPARAGVDAYLAFGGNLGDAASAIVGAWRVLAGAPGLTGVALSPRYRTAPVGGPAGQGDYLNAVGRFRTALPPGELLAACLAAERCYGRVRAERWGARTLDVDLLLYGGAALATPDLTLPHARLRERLFVLVPLLDVAPPTLVLPPDGAPLNEVVAGALRAAGQERRRWRALALARA